MNIDIIHKTGACSTLILSDLNSDTFLYDPEDFKSSYSIQSLEEFKKTLKYRLDTSKTEDHVGRTKHPYQFSFLLASTNNSQSIIQGYMRELGFQETPAVFNRKNGTVARLYIIPVYEIMNTLGCENAKKERD